MPPSPRRIPQSDCDAVEGIPLSMIIVMVVLAITIPMIFGSLRAYDRSRAEAALISEMDNFASMVQLIYTSGPGNSAMIEFDALAGGMTGIDYVIFGDEPGSGLASVIRYKFQGRTEAVMMISSPNVPMMSDESMGLQISSGSYKILAECISGQLGPEGTLLQTYVQLRISQ